MAKIELPAGFKQETPTAELVELLKRSANVIAIVVATPKGPQVMHSGDDPLTKLKVFVTLGLVRDSVLADVVQVALGDAKLVQVPQIAGVSG